MTIEELRAKRDGIVAIAARHGASNVRVFGSVARGDSGPDSDVDLLVTLDEDRSLLDIVRLCREIQALLGARVDVVTDRSLRELRRDSSAIGAVPL